MMCSGKSQDYGYLFINLIVYFISVFLQLKRDKPETLPDLKNVVEEKFEALESRNSDLDLQGNEKYVHFKEQLRQMKAQCKSILYHHTWRVLRRYKQLIPFS